MSQETSKINTIQEYVTKLQLRLDQAAIEEATSGWMEDNVDQVEYMGGDKVKMPSLETTGLADYDRDKGFKQGSVTLTWETYTMMMDRGIIFQIDEMDKEETANLLSAGNAVRVFQKEHVVPEIDAYRYATIASKAISAGNYEEYLPQEDTVIDKLISHIREVEDKVGSGEIIVSATAEVQGAIDRSTKFQRFINQGEFKKGALSFRVKTIDDHPLIRVPKERFKTKFIFNDGESEGQKEGGFVPAADAKDINWIVSARKSPIALSKTDKIRIFTPDVNQRMRAYQMDYRKYHGLWIVKSNLDYIYTSIKPA